MSGKIEQVVGKGYYCIVHSRYLVGTDAVFVDDSAARKVADRDDMVGIVHSVFFNREHSRVDIAARTVEVSGVNMYDEGLSGNILGMNAARVCEPVV